MQNLIIDFETDLEIDIIESQYKLFSFICDIKHSIKKYSTDIITHEKYNDIDQGFIKYLNNLNSYLESNSLVLKRSTYEIIKQKND